MKTSENTDKIYAAIFAVKKEMKAVAKTSDNPFFKSKYADLNTHLDEVEPLLEKYGCMVLQPTTADLISCRTYSSSRIVHVESGQWIEGSMMLETPKLDMQNLGSASTYSRRFVLSGLLSMKAEDDDGNFVSGKTEVKTIPVTKKEVTETKPTTTSPAPSFRRPVKPQQSQQTGDDL